MSAETGLRLERVAIALRGRRLLAIDDHIRPGETLTVMGPSGSGKSMLFAMIAGFLDPAFESSGHIHLDGKEVDGLAPERRRIGLLFQDALPYPHMSVGENLLFALPPQLRGRRARRQAAEAMLAKVDLTAFMPAIRRRYRVVNDGATVVRWERGVTPTVTSMGFGTTLPPLNSATGRVFSHGRPSRPSIARDTEMRRAMRNPALLPDTAPNRASITEVAQKIRERGFASVDGQFIPGLVAASAPILDWQGEAQAAVTLMGVDPEAVVPGAPAVEALLKFCRDCSVVRDVV